MKQKNYFNDARRSRWLPTLVMLLAMFAGGVSPAWAQTTENFSTAPSWPDGWSISDAATSSDYYPESDASNDYSYTGKKGLYGQVSSGTTKYVITPTVTGNGTIRFKRRNSSNGSIYVYTIENDGTLSSSAIASNTSKPSSWTNVTYNIGTDNKKLAIVFNGRIDYVTYTAGVDASAGIGIYTDSECTASVKDGVNLSWCLVNSAQSQTYYIKNESGADWSNLAITHEGNADVSAVSASLANDGVASFTITQASTGSTSDVISITAGDDLTFTINAIGTVKDDAHLFESFLVTEKPSDWTSSGTWSYSDTNGASNTTYYESDNYRLITPLVKIEAGDILYFDAMGTYSGYQGAKLEYSTDGTNWTAAPGTITLTSEWQTFAVTGIPAGNYYLAIHAWQARVRNFYGGKVSTAPVLALSQNSWDFGLISANSTSSDITITNTGKSALTGLNIISDNENFTVAVADNATTIAENGGTATFTVTMAPNATGAQSATITVKSDNADDLTFTATGAVAKPSTTTEDFSTNTLPSRWTNSTSYSWTFSDGVAYAGSGSSYSGYPTLTTPTLKVAADDFLAIKAKAYSSTYGYLKIYASTDGSTFSSTALKEINYSDLSTSDYKTIIVDGLTADIKALKFVGYYVYVDEIAGLTYGAELIVKDAENAIQASGLTYPFGEVGANKSVSYTFSNGGAGTINITNVESSNAVFTTNFDSENKPAVTSAESFTLNITANYDADKAGEQNGAITVTTTEGEFVINLTSTFQAANTPKMDMYLGDATQEGYTDEKSATGANLGFGIITANATKKFTIYNSGTGALNITGITLPDADYSTDLEAAPTTESPLVVAAGAKKVITVTLAANAKAVKTGNITVTTNAEGIDAFSFNANAYVLKDCETVDFADGIPSTWTNGGWSVDATTNKDIYTASPSKPYLTTPKMSFSANDFIIVNAKKYDNDSGDYIQVQYSTDNGSTWTDLQKLDDSTLPTRDAGYSDIVVSNIPEGTNKLRFQGYYARIKTIAGLTYDANDPKLAVYSDAEATLAVTSGTAKDFGWVANTADATAFTSTYYIKNVGTGTLTITGITTEGCTATTAGDAMTIAANAADPLALTITMDKAVEGVKSGIVTLTTDGGNFEIPVKGFVYGNKNYIDFTADGAAFPAGWSTGSWTISEGAAVSTSASTIETKSFTVAANEKLYIDINGNSGNGTKELSYSYSTDNGENWSDAVTLASASGYGTVAAQIFTISDIADVTEERTVLIKITGQNLGIKHIYGFTAVLAPNLSTTAADINFGMQTAESAEQSFTITNDGTATLEGLSVTLGKTNAGDYSITSMKIGSEDFSGTELLAGQTITVTVKQNYDINNLGAKSDVLTISAEGQTPVTINLTGKTRDGSKQYIDFAAGIPDGWTTTGGWTASSGYVYTSAENTLRMLPITVAANEKLSVDARLTYSTGGSLKARYTTNSGVEWTEIAIPAVYNYSDFTTYEIDLGNTDNAVTAFIEFVGTSAAIDNIYGGVATTAPLINITEGGTVVANGATKDFGTVTKELIYETASYVIANDGTAALTVKYPDVTGNFSAGVSFNEGVSNDSEGNYVIEPTKSITFTVNPTFNPPYGEQNGTMTVKSGNGDDIITVNLKASFVDPTALYIDFADNKKPAGWYNGSWTFSNSYAQAPSTAADLITEMFDVTDDKKVLTFDVWSTSNSTFYEPALTVYTSSDNRKTWTEAKVVEIAYNETTAKSVTLDALTAGTPVYVKFVGKYVAVDNIAGLSKIITEPEHDLYVVEAEQPDGIVVPGISYTATVNVASLRAAETVAAELWFKNTSDEETKVAELTAQDIALDATKEFVLTGYVPTTEGEYKVYTKVYNGDVSVLTEETDVTLQHTRTLAIQNFARFQDTNEPNVLEADANNQISPSFKVTIKNTGTTALTPIIKVKQGETVVGTATGTELAADATSDEITVAATNMSAGEGGELSFTAEAYWSSEDGATAFTFETPVTITVKAAAPKFELAEGSTALNDGDAVAFGLTKSTVVKTYTISNTGNNTLEVSAISAPEGFEAAYAEKNRDDAEWMLYLYKSDGVKGDVATFKQTGVANQFYVENVEITSDYASGTNFCVRNSDWSTKYGWKDGNTVTETGKAFELATAEGATGWMTLAAGTYNVIFDASNLTITFQPQTTKAIFAGESRDVNVTLKAEQGKVSGNLAFTYKVDATNNATFTLALSGRSVAADTWTEDFATGIPATWQNSGWTAEAGQAYSGPYDGSFSLITPRLAAKENEVLTYDTQWKYDGDNMTVEYSTDKNTWTSYATITANTETVEREFVAPADGDYYIRFTANSYVYLDNFIGFTLNIPEHDTEIAAASIPTTGTKSGTYTATVTLKENAGKAEKVTATLYVDNVEKAAETETITANGSTVVTVTWKPDAVITDAVEAYIQVTADGIDLATDKVNLTIAAPFTLSDTEAPTFAEATTTYEALVLNREFVEGWNTVCLPFAITDIEAFFGAGAKAYTLNSYVAAENTLKFESATTMKASYPYVVYVPAAIASGKVVENVEIGYQYKTPSPTATYFVGTYAPIDDMSGKWGIGTAKDGKAKIMKGSTGAKMKGFRAYFALSGNTQGAPTMMFDEEVITGISAIEMAAEEGERIYNLNGQRVMNPKKGQVYIVNGKKVAIK